jgi:hypothetical protein
MNTTKLIRHWDMSGAGPDFVGHFRSVSGVRAELTHRSQDEESSSGTVEPAREAGGRNHRHEEASASSGSEEGHLK